jgi:hypothetical protein
MQRCLTFDYTETHKVLSCSALGLSTTTKGPLALRYEDTMLLHWLSQ